MYRISYIRLLISSLTILLLSGCTKDFNDDGGSTTEGQPITVTLNLGAIPPPEITITRANNELSYLASLSIFVFNADGSECLQIVDLSYNDLTQNGTYTNQETIYSVKFRTTSGTRKLLAVANYQSGGFWDSNTLADIRDDVENGSLSFDGLRDCIIRLSNSTINSDNNILLPSITASSQMLISGWNQVTFGVDGSISDYGPRGDAQAKIAMMMERSMARITFNIPGGSTTKQVDNGDGTSSAHTVTFTPSTFRAYNIPRAAFLGFTSESATVPDIQQTYLTSAVYNVGTTAAGDYQFSFYMPENIQPAGSAASYNDRDRWNYGPDTGYATEGPGMMPEDKIWSHAPQNSTFVVIEGTYEETTPEGPFYTATVEYTVHLGDFSDQGSWDNFSIIRNYLYTYNMSVLGVDNIVVEAHKGTDNQPGAEGEVYDATTCLYNYQLDSHFEQVFLQYDLSSIANSLPRGLSGQELDDAIASKLFLVIQSEAMTYTDQNVMNKRGSLQPYKIYADAMRNNQDPAKAKADILEGAGSGYNPTKGFDYKWVEFWPQTTTALAEYPGVSEWSREDLTGFDNQNAYGGTATGANHRLMDVYDVCVAMGLVVKKIYLGEQVSTTAYAENGISISIQNGNYMARFTAFVNEYYYYRHPLTHEKLNSWGWMVNKIPREMIIAMSSDLSADGNSIYSQLHSYISQVSMQTFYNTRSSTIDAFGLETYNETPLSFTFMGYNSGTNDYDVYLTNSDGRWNQISLLKRYASHAENSIYGDWDDYINPSYNGFTSTVTTTTASHKLNPAAYTQQYAYSACMSRNRDLNGNGSIDDNEVRWYLASTNEYIRIGIGTNVLSSGAKLYNGTKQDMNVYDYPKAYIPYGALFYTSSPSAERVYWAVERGSYGGVGSYGAMPLRCLRILPAVTGQQDLSTVHNVASDPTYEWDPQTRILKFKDRITDELFRQRAEGPLVEHTEDDPANSFYEGIIVAQDYVGGYYNPTPFALKEVVNFGSKYENPCAEYSETGDGGAAWRVPNLVEMSALVAAGQLNNYMYEAACCTKFSNQKVRLGFAYSTLVYCPDESFLKASPYNTLENYYSRYFKVRCVRDVPEGYFE